MAVSLFPESVREWGAAMVAVPSDQADGGGKSEGVAATWDRDHLKFRAGLSGHVVQAARHHRHLG